MNDDPDLQLVKLCQSGSISAFDELVRKYERKVYRLAFKMLDGEDELDDVAQEIFLKVYQSIKDFRFESLFSTWLTRVAVNHCISHIKKHKRFEFFSLRSKFKKTSIEPQTTVERDEEIEKIHQAINALPLKHKAVIILHYFENYTCEEMADILNCSVGTIKSRLFYARSELKKKLNPYLKDGVWTRDNHGIGGENYEMFKM